ncbi:MAG: YlmC/YmxH family sporulation protein [Syntrophomonadaceae bacterium]|nr:YlmC/YmxH family sporulation protein [Syntrophomonadaceae bacterium]
MIKLSDLKMREVVNVIDGKKLGHIIDLELDVERARVTAIIVPGKMRGWACFIKRDEIIIPWDKIVRIGRDVILVDMMSCSEDQVLVSHTSVHRHSSGYDEKF